MPSIFTRARTTSSKNLPKVPLSPQDAAGGAIDEFGRVSSRGPPSATRDSRRAQTSIDRRRPTNASSNNLDIDSEQIEDGFLPTSTSSSSEQSEREYGYLGHETHVILAIEDVQRIVDAVSEELVQRGLTTPLLFQNAALDLSASAVRRLIDAFLRVSDFREETKFANPHALASFLRWGLARPVRVESGIEQRGLISWDNYLQWRQIEHQNNFNKSVFQSFVNLLVPSVRNLVLSLHSLLSRLLANSTSSGLTPAILSSLFGPLLFGLPVASFHASYAAYLRAAHASEHLLLAYVRLQVSQAPPSAPPPRRLVSWVQGYPAMLAPLDSFEHPRLGARTRRVASVRRNVRLYSEDLVRTCSGWARGSEGIAIRQSKEWGRIAPERRGDRMEPRYSDTYRKKLDLPPGFHPQTSAIPNSPPVLSTPSLSATSSNASTRSSLFDDPADEAKFRSLTDMKWGEFSMLGFGDGAAPPGALQFDLNEGARNARTAKRQTLTWNDFSAAGFSRGDASLSQTLQFAQPIAQSVQQWPAQKEDIHKKLKKNVQKALPPFGWDTAPVMDGREDVIEEGFLDVFCDLLYAGWMDRNETTFRDCNWALIEFKSLPTSRSEAVVKSTSPSLSFSSDPSSQQDLRTATTILLFEEFVPEEYRSSLIFQGSKPTIKKRLGLTNFLSPKKGSKQWKQAATLNGKPYSIGSVPRSPNISREAEFERMLSSGGNSTTKMLSLNTSTVIGGSDVTRLQTPIQRDSKKSSTTDGRGSSVTNLVQTFATLSPASAQETPSKSFDATRTASPFSTASIKKPRFRFPVGRQDRVMIPSEYDPLDFDIRLASYSDEELNNGNHSSVDEKGPAGPAGARPKSSTKDKRMSKDDAWVDILVSHNAKRITGQDAEMRPRGASASKVTSIGSGGVGSRLGSPEFGHSDPDLARKEVAQALANVRLSTAIDEEQVDNSDEALREELNKQVEVREPTLDMLQSSNTNGNGYTSLDIEGEEEEELPVIPKKRLGYFDLHPERRPVDYQDRDRSNISAYDDSAREPSLHSFTDTDVTQETSLIVRQVDGDVEVPAFVDPSGSPSETSKVISSPQTQSKTASLIEMYRERERQAAASVTTPIRPTRTASLPKDDLPAVPDEREPSPEPVMEGESIEALETGTPFMYGDLGQPGPMRYVHGAPLHNVLEEDEE